MSTREAWVGHAPPLLERFLRVVPERRDPREAPRSVAAAAGSGAGSAAAADGMSEVGAALVADVRANIERLLKTTAPLAAWLRRGAPRGGAGAERSRLERSVLAYGMPELIGQLRAGIGAQAFCAALRDALLDHEPRIDPDSLRILVDEEEPDRMRVLSGEFDFRIDARVRGLDGEHGALRVRTVVHPFRAPEVDIRGR